MGSRPSPRPAICGSLTCHSRVTHAGAQLSGKEGRGKGGEGRGERGCEGCGVGPSLECMYSVEVLWVSRDKGMVTPSRPVPSALSPLPDLPRPASKAHCITNA